MPRPTEPDSGSNAGNVSDRIDIDRLAQLSQEYERLHEQLEGLYSRWTQLNAELDELAVAASS